MKSIHHIKKIVLMVCLIAAHSQLSAQGEVASVGIGVPIGLGYYGFASRTPTWAAVTGCIVVAVIHTAIWQGYRNAMVGLTPYGIEKLPSDTKNKIKADHKFNARVTILTSVVTALAAYGIERLVIQKNNAEDDQNKKPISA